ncbi:MAG TPA: ferrous iron transporter B [Acidobacteriaceae bacterium]|nr:ferrous iron transporter B [Acidobacteriaceae bacterium]
MSDCCGPVGTATIEPVRHTSGGKISTVVLVGPPNSGKSTLFNRLTGLRQKVANYPGVTVEQHYGRMGGIGRGDLTLIDLPGIHSLNSYSEDARVAVDVLHGNMPGTPAPDAVLLVLDALQLNRQLMLAGPVLALGLPTLVLLNMADLMTAQGGEIDPLALAQELGAPVALICAKKGTGLEAIGNFVRRLSDPDHVRASFTQLPVLQTASSCRQWATQVSSRTRYKAPLSSGWTRRLDGVLLHKVWGPLIFLAVVIGVFQVVFTAGLPLSDWLGELFTRLGSALASLLPAHWMQVLLRDGIWNGMQAVMVFLPQILLLFLVIGILEDSGYLARAALIADRVMRSIGLNGKAFIPLLSAYACAVPAIMATRTIENKRDRLATILVAPFMTCSARLPIYTLIIAAFIPNRKILGDFFGLRAAVMLSLYLLGFLAALATARLLKSSVLKANSAPFILELPQYRWPTLRSMGLRLLDRGTVFVKQTGTVILAVTFVLWLLSIVPVHGGHASALAESYIGQLGHFIEPALRPLGLNWKVGIGLLSSIIAREVIVGTLGTLYGADPATHSLGLQTALRHDIPLGGAIALVVFFAFAMQCTSTLAVVRRETNSWKWPAAQFVYMSGLAYLAALVTNQVLSRLF